MTHRSLLHRDAEHAATQLRNGKRLKEGAGPLPTSVDMAATVTRQWPFAEARRVQTI